MSKELTEADLENVPFDRIVEETLSTITVKRTTDHNQHAKFEYVFTIGEETFRFELDNAKHDGHMNVGTLKSRFEMETGIAAADPTPERKNEWVEFVHKMIQRRGKKETFTGGRSKAVHALKREIERREGYTDPVEAYKQSGVYVDEEAGELWIRADEATNIWDEHCDEELHEGVGIYGGAPIELDARGHTVDHGRDTMLSHREPIGRFWALDINFAEPAQMPPKTDDRSPNQTTQLRDE